MPLSLFSDLVSNLALSRLSQAQNYPKGVQSSGMHQFIGYSNEMLLNRRRLMSKSEPLLPNLLLQFLSGEKHATQ